jgi:Protein of unknown function (DUF4239)
MGGLGAPLWLLLGFVVAVAIAIAVGSIWLGNRTLPAVTRGRDHNPMMAPFVAVVGLLYGGLLGFTVVATWEQFSSTQVTIVGEASALTTMYRETVAMPQPEQTELQQMLRNYASAVVGPDRAKPGSENIENARAAITNMYRIVGGQPGGTPSNAINSQFLNQLAVLASDRNERIIGTRPRIPPLLWTALIFGGIVLVTLTGFLRLGSNLGHAVVSCTIAVLLGLLLCIVFAFDHSFSSGHGIAAVPFQHALDIFDAVDRGK